MPLSPYSNGCIAGEGFHNGYSILVWGGIDGQPADGAETYNVRILNRNKKPVRFSGKITLKEQTINEIISVMEHFQRRK